MKNLGQLYTLSIDERAIQVLQKNLYTIQQCLEDSDVMSSLQMPLSKCHSNLNSGVATSQEIQCGSQMASKRVTSSPSKAYPALTKIASAL